MITAFFRGIPTKGFHVLAAVWKTILIGTREFAEKYGVTQATVSKWCREGKIPNCNQDGKGSPWHIPKDAVPPVGYKQRKK